MGARRRRQTIVLALLLGAVGVTIAMGSAGANPGGSPSAPSYFPAEKAKLYQQQLDAAAAARKHPPAKPPAAQARSQAAAAQTKAGTTDVRVAGLTEHAQGPFPSAVFRVDNLYQASVNGRWLLAYAGSSVDASEAKRGAVRVLSESSTGSITSLGEFPAPIPGTYVRIIACSGTVLTLASDTGATARFDLASLAYL
jgi:hypothetical protein